jgi:hypothetical protein
MISPKEAYEKAKSSPQEMKKLEEMVDNALIESMRSGSNQTTIDAKKFPSDISRKEIMNKYMQAGWNVKYESDQRDGDYISFKNKETSTNEGFYDQRETEIFR